MTQAKSGRADRQSSDKAEAILAGGMQEFLAHGYAATSMDRVAIAAKVSKATVYSHFQDKESLFIALIQHLVEDKFQSVFNFDEADVLHTDPAIVLRRVAHRVLDIATSEPQFLNLMRVVLGESGRFPQLARAFVQNVDRTGFSIFRHYFATCPALKLADPEATARVFIGSLVHYLIVQDMLHGNEILPLERDRLVETLVNLIVPQAEV